MRIFFPTLAALLLLAAAGPAAAQSTAPQPPATPPSQPAERKPADERPRNLNLKLDDASRHRIMSGSSEERTGGGADLPSLGGNARAMDRAARPDSVFPKESTSTPTPY